MNARAWTLALFASLGLLGPLAVEPARAATITDAKVYLPLNGNLTNYGSASPTIAMQDWGTGATETFSASANGTLGTALDLAGNTRDQATNGTALKVDYSLTNNGTISFWYYAKGPWFDYASVLSSNSGPGNQGNNWEIWTYATGELAWKAQSTAGPIKYDLDSINSPNGYNNWYHIAVTWQKNGSNNVDLQTYVNGTLRASVANLSSGWIAPGSTLWFGGEASTAAKNEFNDAKFDEIRIYDRVLSITEVGMAMNAATVPEPSSFAMLAFGMLSLWLFRRGRT